MTETRSDKIVEAVSQWFNEISKVMTLEDWDNILLEIEEKEERGGRNL